jgi:hypothetical protein
MRRPRVDRAADGSAARRNPVRAAGVILDFDAD